MGRGDSAGLFCSVVFSERAQPIGHSLDTGNDTGVVSEENATESSEEGLQRADDGQNAGDACRGDRNETYGENSCPDVPGGVGTDTIASSECSSCHDCTTSTNVRGEASCGRTGSSEKRECSILYVQSRDQVRRRKARSRTSRTPTRDHPLPATELRQFTWRTSTPVRFLRRVSWQFLVEFPLVSPPVLYTQRIAKY